MLSQFCHDCSLIATMLFNISLHLHYGWHSHMQTTVFAAVCCTAYADSDHAFLCMLLNRYLLEHGDAASMARMRENKGRTPVFCALQGADYHSSADCLALMLETHFDPTEVTPEG